MWVSKKTDYALRALFTLVESEGRGPVPIRKLAEENDIPRSFLEHILLDMKAQGWIASIPGKHGGYQLDRSSSEIFMGQVVRLFDGQLAPIACVSRNAYEPCSQEERCRFRRVFLQVRNMTASFMDRLTLAEIFRGKPVSREELNTEVFVSDGLGI